MQEQVYNPPETPEPTKEEPQTSSATPQNALESTETGDRSANSGFPVDYTIIPPRTSQRVSESLTGYRIPGSKRLQIPRTVRDAVIRRDDGYCVYCNYEATCVDHIVPWAFGGLAVMDNLVASCDICNAIVSDKIFDTFALKREYIRTRYGPFLQERVKRIRRKLTVCADCREVYRPRVNGSSNVLCSECYARDDRKHRRKAGPYE